MIGSTAPSISGNDTCRATKLIQLPLLKGMEHEGNSAHARHVQFLHHTRGLLVILTCGAANEHESREIDDRVDYGLAILVIEGLPNRAREVKSTGVDGHNAQAATLKLGDEGDVEGRC